MVHRSVITYAAFRAQLEVFQRDVLYINIRFTYFTYLLILLSFLLFFHFLFPLRHSYSHSVWIKS